MIDAAEQVRALRNANGWTIRQLAEKSGVSPMTISHIERMHSNTTLWVYENLMAAFGFRVVLEPMEEDEK